MTKTKIPCPNCKWVSGRFCIVCGGSGFVTGPTDSDPYDTRNLKYRSDDPDGEKRRLCALNIAINVYNMGRGGWSGHGDGGLDAERIPFLAWQFDRFVKGEYEP